MKKVIIDGDWGGDEMQLAAVLLAHPEQVHVLGATAVFGNTHHDQVLDNAARILTFLKASHVPLYPGARRPIDSIVLEGDGAHGDDGMGGLELPAARVVPQKTDAADFILQMLRDEPPESVWITATGPQTNIARAIEKDIATMSRVAGILVMGGCTEDIPAADMPFRKGNITPEAEFNFQQAARDADVVLNSGLPVTLFPMNCTQQMSFTPEWEQKIRVALSDNSVAADIIARLCKAPEALDRMKFDAYPFMHDIHTAFYLIRPEMYEGRKGTVHVAPNGRTDFMPDEAGILRVMETIRDPEHLFNCLVASLKKTLLPKAPARFFPDTFKI